MRKHILPAIGGIAGVVALYFIVMYVTLWRFQVSTDNAYVQADIATIAPKLAGYVASVDVGDNEVVRKGQVLVTLDTSDLAPKVEQARATADAKRAAIANIDAKQTLQKSLIAQAQAAVASAAADATRAGKDLERARSLSARGFASTQSLDTLRAAAERADAAVQSARAALRAQQDQIAVNDSSKTQAEAELKQAEASLALAESDLANSKIVAPIDGIIGNRTVRTGQYVRAGTQVMVVVPLPNIYVVANFKETQITDMRAGQAVAVTIDGLPDETYEGRIESFAPASGALFSLLPPENATGNFTKIVQRIPVRIMIAGDAEKLALLRAGMSAGVTVDLRESKAVAPQTAQVAH